MLSFADAAYEVLTNPWSITIGVTYLAWAGLTLWEALSWEPLSTDGAPINGD